MSFSSPPRQIQGLLFRPGASWSDLERQQFLSWLHSEKTYSELVEWATRILKKLNHPEPSSEAADVVDEVLSESLDQIIATFDPARGRTSILSFLSLCLSRECYHRARAFWNGPPLVSLATAGGLPLTGPQASPEDTIDLAICAQCLQRCLQSIRPPSREIIVMSYFDELTHADIAATLRITEGNARVRLHRALHELRHFLTQECPGCTR